MHRYSWYLAGAIWILWGIGVYVWVDPDVFRQGWPIAPTMLVGSFIAGSTSVGGGAVAFPVMTLVLNLEPQVARDFALMIQSVGMGAASIGIVLMRIPVQWKVVLWSNLGGLAGIWIGFRTAAAWSPPLTKMFFVSLWASFALALYLANRRGRSVVDHIERFDDRKIFSFVGIGVIGGFVSGLTGSGLDILTFAVMTMVYRLNESIATPTSVVVMASNAILGVTVRELSGEVHLQALNYWWCAVPVVVVGAPLGAWYIHNKSRNFITQILYFSIAAQFIGALMIVPQTPVTAAVSATTIIVGAVCFLLMHRFSVRTA